MGMTDFERRQLKGHTNAAAGDSLPGASSEVCLDPIAMRLTEAVRYSGFSRSEIYRRAGIGEIVLLKSGATTLVDVASLRAAVRALPRAVIRAPQPCRGSPAPQLGNRSARIAAGRTRDIRDPTGGDKT
jgi:hypothetical protein